MKQGVVGNTTKVSARWMWDVTGSCRHHLQPSLWQTPDPAAHVPDAPEGTRDRRVKLSNQQEVFSNQQEVFSFITSADSRSLLYALGGNLMACRGRQRVESEHACVHVCVRACALVTFTDML